MTITINDVLIQQKELTVAEFLYLLPMYLRIDINSVDKRSLSERGFIGERLRFNTETNKIERQGHFMMDKGNGLIRDILLDSDDAVAPVDSLEGLAKAMQELFPKGKKDGTNYYWRGNTPEIIRKLQIFFKRYGDIPNEQVIDATRHYVESFRDSNSPYMQLLKYFIWKDKIDGSQDSALLTYIENYSKDEIQPMNNDWTTNLK